ncbi:MAG: methyltransferase type 11 [Thiotrichaceae bacterium IS1]|nr:MAG: methyltransferase type 11 [Thiotrichaceae bacterium IS1]
MNLDKRFLGLLQCPADHCAILSQDENVLIAECGRRYRINDLGIPLFAGEFCSEEARIQQKHYDHIAQKYLENLSYPHTEEYMSYLDNLFLQAVHDANFSQVAEICCGSAEAFRLLENRVKNGVGVDVSVSMLTAARKKFPNDNLLFLQGDATTLPLREKQFDSVFMLGGIHHVNNRSQLFQEIFRILKDGGKFYYREPANDFFLWRWLRAIIYKISPALDENTERPLTFQETVPLLEQVGFKNLEWRTYGFLGYCFFMNSDVLVFNRFFRHLPGIRLLTRGMVKLDDWTVKIPGLTRSGLVVIGTAEKPK